MAYVRKHGRTLDVVAACPYLKLVMNVNTEASSRIIIFSFVFVS